MVTSSFLPGHGGIETYLAELCDQLAPRLAVVAPSKRDGMTLPEDLAYPVMPGPGTMLWPSRRVARVAVAVAERLGTDRILFGTPWPLLFAAARFPSRIRYAVIVHGAELLVPAAVPVLRRRLAGTLAGADVIFAVSDFTAGKVRELLGRFALPAPPIERLYARVDLQRFRHDVDVAEVERRYGIAPGQPVVLCFGRVVPRKGIERLVAAMPEIARRVPDAVLLVAGTGPQAGRLERRARRAGAPVIFAGRVPDELAAAVYARADVFALAVADRWFGLEVEGLGVVLLEAAAAGTPGVTGRSGGTPEAVLDGETGYVIDAADRNSVIESIVELLGDPELARRMGAAGRRHVAEHFSKDRPPEPLLRWLGEA